MNKEICMQAGRETWAIYHGSLMEMLSADEQATPPKKLPRVQGSVVTIPMHGMISQRASIWQMIFGGTSTEQLSAVISTVAKDERVGAIVLDVDSPGGTVSGVQEAADVIWEASQQKPVAAISNSLMASAAYWLASQVGPKKQRLVASPTAKTGSIGVFVLHENIAGMLEQDGIEVTLIAEPPAKTEGNPFEPLSDEAKEHQAAQVKETYDMFVEAVGRGRGMRASLVKDGLGQGRVYGAKQAAEMGLVDRVATLPQLMQELGVQPSGGADRGQVELEKELAQVWEAGAPVVPQAKRDQRNRRIRRKMYS